MKRIHTKMYRPQLLKLLGFGAAGLGALRVHGYVGSYLPYEGQNLQTGTLKKVLDPGTVSVVRGSDCRDITFQTLMKIEDEIMASLEGKKRILVKPNFVVTDVPLCATNVDSVRGILDFLKPRWKGPIVVGESTASRDGTVTGFRNYGYLTLEKEYGISLTDLNEGAT
ncbi:MAG: hypothetical protein JW801_13645 [Bacteroidales bacterium]|nr:hypothetical protein [Bacteroidales bacterium]